MLLVQLWLTTSESPTSAFRLKFSVMFCLSKNNIAYHIFYAKLLDETCDGIFHCLYGEDEVFELCEPVFPEIATIKCIENRAEGINLTILAIPCDGIKECRDGSDEDCGSNNNILYSSMIIFLLLTILIWCWIRYDVSKYSSRHEPVIEQYKKAIDYQYLKGDQLVQLTVNFIIH